MTPPASQRGRLRPRLRFWLLTLAALLGLTATLSLGRWQLSRAAQKEALQAAIEAQRAKPPLDQRAVLSAADATALVHRPVRLQGRWLAQHTVYLDNRQMHGQPGFFVVTPLQLAGSERSVLVQRGWARRNFVDRAALPSAPLPEGEVTVEGRMAPPPPKLYAFDAAESGPIRQNLDLAAFAGETRLALLPVSVLQTGAGGEGLLRDWPDADLGTAKHYGYAFQWFGLSSLIAVLYLWFQMVRPRLLARRRPSHGA